MARLVCTERGAGAGREVAALAVCAEGGALAAGAGRGVRVWRWARGAGWVPAGAAGAAHRHALTALGWSPAAPGALLASAGLDAALRFWATAPAPHRHLPTEASALRLVGWAHAARAAPVRTLAWARRGHLLCAGHADGCIMVWRVEAARRGFGVLTALMARLDSHEAALHALALVADDMLVLACCMDGVLKLWRMQDLLSWGCRDGGADGQQVAECPAPLTWLDAAHSLGALCACAAPRQRRTGHCAATAGHDHAVRVWDIADDALVLYTTLEGHESGVTDVRWTTRLVSVSLDRTARVWAVADVGGVGGVGNVGDVGDAATDSSCLLVVAAHSRYITSLALDPEARFFITGSNDKSFKMWSLGTFSLEDDVRPSCNVLDHFGQGDLEGIEALPALFEPTPPVESVAASEGSGARVVHRSAASARGGRRGRRGGRGRVASVACAKGLVAAVVDSAVCVWRMSPCGALEVSWRSGCADGGGGGASLAWLCDGDALLSAVCERVTLWDTQSGAVLREFRDAVETRGVAASGAGRVTILLAGEKSLALYQLDDPRPLHVWEGGGAWCGALGPGARVAAGGAGGGAEAEGRLCVFAARPPYQLLAAQPSAHDTGVECVSFAPSAAVLGECEWAGGEHYALATAGNDDYVRLWLLSYHESEEEVGHLSCVRRVAAHGGGALRVVWCGVGDVGVGVSHVGDVALGDVGVGVGHVGDVGHVGPRAAHVLLSGGGDGWVRAWAPRDGRALWALPAQAAGITPVLDAVTTDLGTFVVCCDEEGAVCVWAAGEDVAREGSGGEGEGEGGGLWLEPRLWGTAARWLYTHVLSPAGVSRESELGVELLAAARNISGASLLDDPISSLMADFGFDASAPITAAGAQGSGGDGSTPPLAHGGDSPSLSHGGDESLLFASGDESPLCESDGESLARGGDSSPLAHDSQPLAYERVRERLRAELEWLRLDELPDSVVSVVAHGWLCPLRHGAGGAGPLRAPDGLSYCARALAAWTQAYGDISPASAAPWSRDQLVPNAALREKLRLAARGEIERDVT